MFFLGLEQSGKDASELIKSTDEIKQKTAEKETEVQEARAALYSKLEIIGNLVHDSVPISNDEVCMTLYVVFYLWEFGLLFL